MYKILTMKHCRKYFYFILVICIGSKVNAQADSQGLYASKISSPPSSLPLWSSAKEELPSPRYDEDTMLVQLYWKAWELAYHNFYQPSPGSGFVSPFIDAAFNDNIFLWDTGFMTLFCNYGYPVVPGIGSLDNFYARQHETGEICREIVRKTGKDFGPWTNTEDETLFSRWGYNIPTAGVLTKTNIKYVNRSPPTPNPLLTLDGMNHPLLAWAEWESYLLTGNKERLYQVWKPLVKYYEAFEKYLRQGNGLYMTDWASMDNSERDPWLNEGGTGIDISSEMVLFARSMEQIATATAKPKEALIYRRKAASLAKIINQKMWDEKQKFYVDLTVAGKQTGIKTIAGYWTLIGEIASSKQAAYLVDHLNNQATFGRINPVPTLAADEKDFAPYGNYWNGSVWAPTNTMVISGLEKYGYNDEAYTIALKHLHLVEDVYKKTGTIWETYSPDSITYGLHKDGSAVVKDFVGWSGIAPIKYFIEYGIGLRANAIMNEITWNLRTTQKAGCKNFRFNNKLVTLMATPAAKQNSEKTKIEVESTGAFLLKINRNGKTNFLSIKPGVNTFIL